MATSNRTLFFLLLVSCASISLSARNAKTNEEPETGPARLLIEKKIMNKYLVEGKDIIVHYHVYNVGKTAAVDIRVDDLSLDPQFFAVTSGVTPFLLTRLESGSNVSHSVIYRPRDNVWGQFNFTSARVSYKSEGESVVLTGLTSEPGQGFIVTQREFERKFSSHALDWIAFILMTLPCVLLPWLLYNKSKNKYEVVVGNGEVKHINKTKWSCLDGGLTSFSVIAAHLLFNALEIKYQSVSYSRNGEYLLVPVNERVCSRRWACLLWQTCQRKLCCSHREWENKRLGLISRISCLMRQTSGHSRSILNTLVIARIPQCQFRENEQRIRWWRQIWRQNKGINIPKFCLLRRMRL